MSTGSSAVPRSPGDTSHWRRQALLWFALTPLQAAGSEEYEEKQRSKEEEEEEEEEEEKRPPHPFWPLPARHGRDLVDTEDRLSPRHKDQAIVDPARIVPTLEHVLGAFSLEEKLKVRSERVETAAMLRQGARDTLARFFAYGLRRRLGRQLFEVEREVYGELLRRGIEFPRGIAVCQECQLVFHLREEGTAQKCDHCRGKPKLSCGSWAAPTFDPRGTPRGWSLRHARLCADCREPFVATDARARFCPNHRGSVGSMARKREVQARRHKPRRFAWMGARPLSGISVAMPSGRTADLRLTRGGWVVEALDPASAEALGRLIDYGDLKPV